MTAPNTRPWQQLPGGYDAQRAAAGQPPAAVPGQQQQQPLTALGSPTPQAVNNQPLFPENTSPLSQMPARQLPWERQPQQQQQPVQQQQQFQQQPAQQQQQPAPQQQFQVPQGVDLNARIYGQNIPQELQGRTVGEVVGMINGLRQVHLSQMQQQPAPQAPVAQQQPAAPVAQPQAFDWKSPDQSIGRIVDDRLQNAIDTKLGPMLAPVLLQGQVSQAQNAMQQAAAEIPNFQNMLPAIFAVLQGVPPNVLANKETWKTAAKVVAGESVLSGQHPQAQPGMYPQQQVQPGQSPLPNLNSFYTEQPLQGGPIAQGVRLSQEQLRAADAMGISHADYAAWAVGVSR